MKLVVKDAVSLAASTENEDAWGTAGGNAAWVIDGATGLGDNLLCSAGSDAAAYAKETNAQLENALAAGNANLKSALRRSITELEKWVETNLARKPRDRFELPSAAAAIINILGNVLHMAFLGDVKCVHVRGRECETYGFSPLGALEEQALRELVTIQETHPDADVNEIRRLLTPTLRRNRSLMNIDGGYWVMSNDSRAADNAHYASADVQDGDHVILLSDGFYRLIDTFHVYSTADLACRAMTKGGLQPLYNQLRDLEENDPECRRYPRVKKADDATAVLLSVAGAV